MPELRYSERLMAELLKRKGAVSEGDGELRELLNRAQVLCKQVYEASKQVPSS